MNEIGNESFTVVCWNILLDQGRVNKGLIKPQSERIDSQIETLNLLEKSGVALDVVGICEAEQTKQGQHNGSFMSQTLTGKRGYWDSHNEIRRHHRREYIGLFGSQVDNFEVLKLPANKKAVITQVHDVPVAMVHFTHQLRGSEREQQSRALLERYEDEETGVIMGDFNALPAEKARRLIYKAGFISVFEALGKAQPATCPTPAYWDATINVPVRERFVKHPMAADDVYVKGLSVEDANAEEGNSDHKLIWAKVTKPSHRLPERTVAEKVRHALYAGRATLKPFI